MGTSRVCCYHAGDRRNFGGSRNTPHTLKVLVKSSTRSLLIIGLIVVLAMASGGIVYFVRYQSPSARAKRMKNPVPATAETLATGGRSYIRNCQKCHGEKGNGLGEKAPELSVAPSDFTNAKEMDALADGELFEEITKGNLPMPAFEDKLSEQERWQLVDYIRTFSRGAGAAH
jgi:mono/diheme cytochrome c family protein